MVSVVPILAPLLVGERRVVFKNITWQGYQQLREIVGEKRAAKMMSDRGILEITMPYTEVSNSPTFPICSKQQLYEFLAVAQIDEVEAEVNLRQWIKSQS